jgi:RNA polymerase sigma-70 factor (ECF subfamily)
MTASRLSDASGRMPDPSVPEPQRSLAPSLYRDLRKLAARKMRFERVNHTLQPTALVHEAWMNLGGARSPEWSDRAHFLAAAAQVMRHILVDRARARNADKRGAGAVQVTLDDNLVPLGSAGTDVLMIDEVLKQLAGFDARQARILEMHFFAGMTFEEIAASLGISVRTAKRDSTMARAWLRSELSPRR